MNLSLVERIVNAVLYEGYILYPYRPSAVKNQQRWNFGALYPQTYSEAQAGTDACTMQTECLVLGDERTPLEVKLRFLHLVTREVGMPVADMGVETAPQFSVADSCFRVVGSLEVGNQIFQTWQEAIERDVSLPTLSLSELARAPQRFPFAFPSSEGHEPILDESGQPVGMLLRKQESIEGTVELRIEDCGLRIEENGFSSNPQSSILNPQLFKVSVRILNLTPFEDAENKSRDEALMRTLISTHTILGTGGGGEFVSLLDPPEALREIAAQCQNTGTWPVLVGEEGERDCLLSSPIILYDYPQVAPESAGELFDSTEIDEILTLRIMTLTDEEKRQMRGADERARRILERTETMPAEQMMKLHGGIKKVRSEQ